MSASDAFTLSKEERICSRTLVEKLFNGGGSHTMSAFPLRVVYLSFERTPDTIFDRDAQVQMLVSVPKRHFKRAVKRNRVKRQVREAFRKNKAIVTSLLSDNPNRGLAMAFIWQDANLRDSDNVERCVKSLLARMAERL